MDDRHPIITIAHLELLAQVSKKSVTGISIWHHEAHFKFLSHSHTNDGLINFDCLF